MYTQLLRVIISDNVARLIQSCFPSLSHLVISSDAVGRCKDLMRHEKMQLCSLTWGSFLKRAQPII